MNILVTGATGFIGRHLVKRLLEARHSVRCLVRKASNINNLKNFRVDLYEGDLLQPKSLEGILEGIDLVYHLAGIVSSRQTSKFYIGNVIATKNLLEICKNSKIKNFIYVSSIAVYQPPSSKTLLDENSPCKPITPYGKTKLEAERLVLHYFHNYNLPIVIVRGSVVYGPFETEVVTKFFLNLIKKKKIFVIGDGDNFRSLSYIDNFIDGLLLVGEHLESIGRIYNLSDQKAYTLNEILETSSRIIGAKIKIVFLPNWLGNIFWLIYNILEKLFRIFSIELYSIKVLSMNLGCDVSKIANELGYSSQIDLKEGLRRTFEWIRDTYV
ncbi:MAG: NAD(P)-dependent oxidoreductase [Candidatus Omnitrophica bacterium]|nr:NAD(P)-dependent oxidoreductase [Candidatus Omnitrophota bacterium]